MNIETMQSELDVSITPFEKGLSETIGWYTSNKEAADAKE